MESHELLREIFDKKTPKEVSADLELSTSMIYKWAQPREGEGSGVENPLDRIEALLKRAITLDPGLAGAHLQLAILYERRGDYDSAAHEFEAAILLAPELKEAHYRLAGVYRHTGRVELAAREMQLYQQARAQETSQPADSAIGIEQFVSVFDRPVPQTAGAAQCPEATP